MRVRESEWGRQVDRDTDRQVDRGTDRRTDNRFTGTDSQTETVGVWEPDRNSRRVGFLRVCAFACLWHVWLPLSSCVEAVFSRRVVSTGEIRERVFSL